MLDDKFGKSEDAVKWEIEELVRFGRWLLIVYRDEQVIGQLEFHDHSELELWKTKLEELSLPKQ